MVAFASGLPYATRQGYGLEPQDATARTPMEFGTGRVRRRFTLAPTQITLRWIFTQAQFAAFEAWWTQTLLDGSLPVDDLPIINGDGLNSIACNFIGPYRAAPMGVRYEVTARVDTTALPQLTAEELEVASAYALTDIAAAAPALHTLIHSTLPAYW